jgi:hypothetical protein
MSLEPFRVKLIEVVAAEFLIHAAFALKVIADDQQAMSHSEERCSQTSIHRIFSKRVVSPWSALPDCFPGREMTEPWSSARWPSNEINAKNISAKGAGIDRPSGMKACITTDQCTVMHRQAMWIRRPWNEIHGFEQFASGGVVLG